MSAAKSLVSMVRPERLPADDSDAATHHNISIPWAIDRTAFASDPDIQAMQMAPPDPDNTGNVPQEPPPPYSVVDQPPIRAAPRRGGVQNRIHRWIRLRARRQRLAEAAERNLLPRDTADAPHGEVVERRPSSGPHVDPPQTQLSQAELLREHLLICERIRGRSLAGDQRHAPTNDSEGPNAQLLPGSAHVSAPPYSSSIREQGPASQADVAANITRLRAAGLADLVSAPSSRRNALFPLPSEEQDLESQAEAAIEFSQLRITDPANPTAATSRAFSGVLIDEDLEAAYFNPWNDPRDPIVGSSSRYPRNPVRPPTPAPEGEFPLAREPYLRRLAQTYIEPVGRVDSGLQADVAGEPSASSSPPKGKGKARDDGAQHVEQWQRVLDEDEFPDFRPRPRRNSSTGTRGRMPSVYYSEANHADTSEDGDQNYTTADEYQPSISDPPVRVPTPIPEPPAFRPPSPNSKSGFTHLTDCIVCADTKPRLQFPLRPATTACTHEVQTCTTCLQAWLASELSSNGHTALACPDCRSKLSHDDVRRSTSPATFAAFDRLTTQAFLAEQADFAWCLGAGCGSGQLNIEHPKFKNFMKCGACEFEQCLKHGGKWHERESCEQYDYRVSGRQAVWEEMATQATLERMSKLCPGVRCRWRLEKIEGCDHMTCRKCRHQFCWECLAAMDDIKRHGDAGHKITCKYYSVTTVKTAWPFNVH